MNWSIQHNLELKEWDGVNLYATEKGLLHMIVSFDCTTMELTVPAVLCKRNAGSQKAIQPASSHTLDHLIQVLVEWLIVCPLRFIYHPIVDDASDVTQLALVINPFGKCCSNCKALRYVMAVGCTGACGTAGAPK